jgi:arylsulfatase A-like enzyme
VPAPPRRGSKPEARRPNILLVTTDQQRADSIGAYGNDVCRTPNLDRLAAAGTRFSSARTQHPYSQPSRASLLTGRHPSSTGVFTNGVDLPADMAEAGLASLLANAGYATAIFGKAQFATAFPALPSGSPESLAGSAAVDPDWHGPYAGFDRAELVLFGHNVPLMPLAGSWNWCFGPPPFGLHYARFLFRDGFAKGVERLRLMQPEAAGLTFEANQTWPNQLPAEDHWNTWVADRAVEWIRGRSAPWFAWVSFPDPHHPMDPPAPWSRMYTPADVAHRLPRADPAELAGKPPLHAYWAKGFAGTPLRWRNPGGANLKPLELAAMTAGYYGMVSHVDHEVGRLLGALDETGQADDTLVVFTSDHGDYLGEHLQVFKGPLPYEGLLRVPLILRGPGVDAGRVVDDPVGLIDVAPTLLSRAGCEVPPGVDGRRLDDLPRDHVITENDHRAGLRVHILTLTGRRHKLSWYADREDTGELYDLQEDPRELVNRWADPSLWNVREEMLRVLREFAARARREEPVLGLLA